ncbi:MAG: hypothetical protein ACXWRZ_16575 [Bdellovibrio sp.]
MRYFGFQIGDLRSSDLWKDTVFTTEVADDLQAFDIVLINKNQDSYGAHIGLCIGNNKILHLSKKEGKPVVWDLDQFGNLDEYAIYIGAKRPKLRNSGYIPI